MIVTVLTQLAVNVKSNSPSKRWKIQCRSQTISTKAEMWKAWKEEMEVCSISLFCKGVTSYGFILDADKEIQIRRDLD